MLSKLSVISLMVTISYAALHPNEAEPYFWTVQSLNGTCSATACWAWDFSISGLVGPSDQPAFKAINCSIDSRIDEPQRCKNVEMDVPGHVDIQIEDASSSGGLLSVQYTFEQGPVRYTYCGNHSVTQCANQTQPTFLGPNEFVVVPYAFSAVGG